jgi:hypothetical protein
MAATAIKNKSAKKKKASLLKQKSGGYNDVKFHDGQQYTGMAVGRSHKWYYDKGDWRETKIDPELWEISYAVTKRRAGHAPQGSGVPLGTEYHWYIMAHQMVRKLNKDDYSTSLTGLKFKLSHKRAIKDKWASSSAAQRKKLVQFMKQMILDMEAEPLEFEFEYNNEKFKGEATPITASCNNGTCQEFDVSVNNSHLGILKHLKSGWKMDNATDAKFIKVVGKAIDEVS